MILKKNDLANLILKRKELLNRLFALEEMGGLRVAAEADEEVFSVLDDPRVNER